MMELSEVGTRLGIDNRVLRYLMEQELVPGLTKVNQGRGSRRKLTIPQARLVGVAAVLHVQGYRPPVLAKALKKTKTALRARESRVMMTTDAVSITIDLSKICRAIG